MYVCMYVCMYNSTILSARRISKNYCTYACAQTSKERAHGY